jgi:cytidyltransferase-like protein
MIITNPSDLPRPLVLTSGGYDPLHFGHIRCIRESSKMGHLLVVVMADTWLMRKKNYVFQELDERMEIVDSIKGVEYVTSWDDGTSFVAEAIRLFHPDVFTKGGDWNVVPPDEEMACQEVGCKIVYGVGGGKIQNSSKLVERIK